MAGPTQPHEPHSKPRDMSGAEPHVQPLHIQVDETSQPDKHKPTPPPPSHLYPSALLPVADGSEEVEVMAVVDVLRRAHIRLTIATVEPHQEKLVNLMHGLRLRADKTIEEAVYDEYDLIVLPGGKGADRLGNCDLLIKKLRQQKTQNKWYGGICSAPCMVLRAHGLLQGLATTHPMYEKDLEGRFVHRHVVVHDNCVTSQGPGTAIEFALTLVQLLRGPDHAAKVARQVLFPVP